MFVFRVIGYKSIEVFRHPNLHRHLLPSGSANPLTIGYYGPVFKDSDTYSRNIPAIWGTISQGDPDERATSILETRRHDNGARDSYWRCGGADGGPVATLANLCAGRQRRFYVEGIRDEHSARRIDCLDTPGDSSAPHLSPGKHRDRQQRSRCPNRGIPGRDGGRHRYFLELRHNAGLAHLYSGPQSGSGGFTVNPTGLTANFIVGARVPDPRTITISGTGGAPLAFTAQAQVSGTPQWLSVQPSAGTTPATISVAVNPTGLAPGTYAGNVVLTGAGNSAPQNIPVKFAVAAPPKFILPRSTFFKFDFPGAPQQTQTIPILIRDNLNTGITVSTTVFSKAAPGWLTAQISNSTVPPSLILTANNAGLGSGFFLARIQLKGGSGETANTMVLMQSGGAGPYRLTPACLWIGDSDPPSGIPEILNGVTTLCPGYVKSSAPTSGTIMVNVDGASRSFMASLGSPSGSSPWLAGLPEFPATVMGMTPANYTFSVDRSQLPPGEQSAFVDIQDAAGSTSARDGTDGLITAATPPGGPEIHVESDLVSLSSMAGDAAMANQGLAVTFTGGTVPVGTSSDSPGSPLQ